MLELKQTGKITSKKQFFALIEGYRIPVLAPGSLSLVTALADDNQTYRDLTVILERFPGMAAKLIALVNSAWSAPIEPITSLEAACSRLGVKIVKSVSTALAVSGSFDTSECLAFSPEYFWSGSLLVAESATLLSSLLNASLLNASHLNRRLPNNLPKIDQATVRTAGLLHNLGLLFLVDLMPAQTHRILCKGRENGSALNTVFKQELGIGITDVGYFLANKWRLPAPLADVMSHYDNGHYQGANHSALDVVSVAVEIVAALNRDINADLHTVTRLGQILEPQNIEVVGTSLSRAYKSFTEISGSISWQPTAID